MYRCCHDGYDRKNISSTTSAQPKSSKKRGFQYTVSRSVARHCREHLVRGIRPESSKKQNATPSTSGGKLSSVGAASMSSVVAAAARGAADALLILFSARLARAADLQSGLKSRAQEATLYLSREAEERMQTKNPLRLAVPELDRARQPDLGEPVRRLHAVQHARDGYGRRLAGLARRLQG